MKGALFVYGTLRKKVGGGRPELLGRGARFVGRARARGRLYSLGAFPAFVPSSEATGRVLGDLWILDRPEETLERLDAYEGCGAADPRPHLFERIAIEVVLESGTEETAWVYAYRGATDAVREIGSGDWADEAGSDCR